MLMLGMLSFAASLLLLARRFGLARRRSPYPTHGWLGLAGLALTAALLPLEIRPVKMFLTPIVWTFYILAVDGAVLAVRGGSLISQNRLTFLWMALLSIPLWLIFEAYNLRLQNWRYEGLPEHAAVRALGYCWSFATIWPAILETGDFLLATGPPHPRGELRSGGFSWVYAGLAFLLAPLLAPAKVAPYLFGFVWIGFTPLLEPLNRANGYPSVARQGRVKALLAAGAICGFVWEFWNYWASARWVYTFPILQNWKIFEMPVIGYLGFPAFGLEVFVMYTFVANRLNLPYYEVK